MRIGIDIDDVITNTSDLFKEYVYKYGSSFFGPNEIEENLKHIMRGNLVTDKIKQFVLKYAEEIVKNVTLKDDVVEVIARLKDKGHEIFLITTRGSKVFDGAEDITRKYLDKHKVPYNDIIFNAYNKYGEILENKIEVMIDDSVEICENLSSMGIKAYLFTSSVNIEQEPLVPRIANWLDLESKF